MNRILVCVLFLTSIVFGQSLDTIQRIEISYGYGEQCFPKDGIYARAELFVFEKADTQIFYLKRSKQYWGKFEAEGNIFKTDSLITICSEAIDSKLMTDLIVGINSNKENFNFSFLKSRLKRPSKHRIKEIAQKRDLLYKIKCDGFLDCKFLIQTIDSIKKFKRFDQFVSSLNLTSSQMITIGFFNEATISFISKNNTVSYYFSFINNQIGQPILKRYNDNFDVADSFVNSEVNEIVRKIIPKNTLTFNAFDLNNITDFYIVWFLNN
uniref:hypothetical protein n=1 Tax=Flavobacterium sp. TaxID=239 RepID=UPI004048F5A9